MKSIQRLLLGVLSSALLAVGLARVSDHLDPMTKSLPAVGADISGSAPTCSTECFLTSNDT